MLATTADTAADLVKRTRASYSWVTNWSYLDASGPTSCCEGPVLTWAS